MRKQLNKSANSLGARREHCPRQVAGWLNDDKRVRRARAYESGGVLASLTSGNEQALWSEPYTRSVPQSSHWMKASHPSGSCPLRNSRRKESARSMGLPHPCTVLGRRTSFSTRWHYPAGLSPLMMPKCKEAPSASLLNARWSNQVCRTRRPRSLHLRDRSASAVRMPISPRCTRVLLVH